MAATGLIEIITAMSSAIDALERELARQFDQHQAEIIMRMPGLGPVLGALVLGDDRFADASGARSVAATAPITRAAGPQPAGHLSTRLRPPPGRCLSPVGLRRPDQVSRRTRGAHYDRRRAHGDTHNAALRHLANKLIGKLWRCLQHGLASTKQPPGPIKSINPSDLPLDNRPAWGVHLRCPSAHR